ncbi:MAG TPA: RNA polymerase sigma factor [Candidatus Paceibacterota bacterium]|nr:RNA polymerase sigma factor [Verrucomicrobiota bacterium]HRY47893.1 RNA polymerase sigma factor [Candidatus Paceibacterota bacterium]HSA03722.1 RNA polymerase sigma factor [Candidatus Paceibacterota bacterium]
MMDPQKFEVFMRNYQNLVFTTAVRLLGREAEAEDVTQEVFLRAYAHFDELEQSPTAGGWLKTVARNLCLNHLSRYRARWRFFSEFQSEDQEDEPMIDFAAPDVHEQTMDQADHRALLDEALQKLPAAQRVPLVLFHFENLAYEEIAAHLGISLSKVKTDIFRGREALRKKLKWRLQDQPMTVC